MQLCLKIVSAIDNSVKFIFLVTVVVLCSCSFTDSNFIALRFEKYNFGLFIASTSPDEVSFRGNLKSKLDGVYAFHIEGDGQVITATHSIIIKGDTLIINEKTTIVMKNEPPYNMVLKTNGEVVEGFLRSFD